MSFDIDKLVNEIAEKCNNGTNTHEASKAVKEKYRLSSLQLEMVMERYSELECPRLAKQN